MKPNRTRHWPRLVVWFVGVMAGAAGSANVTAGPVGNGATGTTVAAGTAGAAGAGTAGAAGAIGAGTDRGAGLASAAGGGAGAVRSAARPIKVSLLLDWYPEAENAGYFYALTHGLYAQAGLDVQIAPLGANATVEPQVALRKYDFGLGSSDQLLIARGRGIPLVMVMGSLQHDPVGVMVHESSPVHGFADLEGRTVAVQPGVPWLLFVQKKYRLRNLKTIPLNFDYAAFLHDPNYIQQCFITSEPPIMAHDGVKVRTLWVKDTGCDAYMALETSESFLAEHPEAVRAFVAASIAGWRGYLADPASTHAEILRRNPAMSALQLQLSRQALLDYGLVEGAGSTVGQIDPERLHNQYTILRDLGIIPAEYDYRLAFTSRFLPPPSSAARVP